MDAARAYHGDDGPERSRPVVKGHLEDIRHTLMRTRDQLRSMLARCRGEPTTLQAGGAQGGQPLEPDHLVFIGEQTVQISGEILKLTEEIAEFV